MFGQLVCAALLLSREASSIHLINIVLIVLVWLSTFLRAVPLHRQFAKGVFNEESFTELCRRNWSRTILWTSIFLLNFVSMIPPS